MLVIGGIEMNVVVACIGLIGVAVLIYLTVILMKGDKQ